MEFLWSYCRALWQWAAGGMARHAVPGQRIAGSEVLTPCCCCAQVFIVIVEQSVLAQRSNDGGVEAAAQQIAELRASMANPGVVLVQRQQVVRVRCSG